MDLKFVLCTRESLDNIMIDEPAQPYYLYATASSNDSTTYPTSLTYNNHVNITGLLPNTTYYYLPSNSNRTTPYSFRTARVAGDMSPFSVAVVVDMGTFGPLGLGTTTGVGAVC